MLVIRANCRKMGTLANSVLATGDPTDPFITRMMGDALVEYTKTEYPYAYMTYEEEMDDGRI